MGERRLCLGFPAARRMATTLEYRSSSFIPPHHITPVGVGWFQENVAEAFTARPRASGGA